MDISEIYCIIFHYTCTMKFLRFCAILTLMCSAVTILCWDSTAQYVPYEIFSSIMVTFYLCLCCVKCMYYSINLSFHFHKTYLYNFTLHLYLDIVHNTHITYKKEDDFPWEPFMRYVPLCGKQWVWAVSQYKAGLSMYWDFHCKDKTVLWPSHLYNGSPYIGKTSLYWHGPLVVSLHKCSVMQSCIGF